MAIEISIVSPAFNEEMNLPFLYQRLCETFPAKGLEWEWIIIDDHSNDSTFQTIQDLAKDDPRVCGLRFSRNFGSHMAISCGLRYASGRCAVVMAADLQDPPEVATRMIHEWRQGHQVVWAARENRLGEARSDLLFARIYYAILRKWVGLDMPKQGADFFLLDRVVIDAFAKFQEKNISILALISWMGFRQKNVFYVKQARERGKSGWNLWKKIKLTLDSVLPFSYGPIRIISVTGIAVSLFGFCYGIVVFLNYLMRDSPVQGWSSLMIALLVLGGMQMLTLGVLGEYIWRGFDESRRRPMYMLEACCGRNPCVQQFNAEFSPPHSVLEDTP